MGDMVMAQSLFKKIKERDRDAIIDVIGPAWSSPILERMEEVRQAITLKTSHGEWGISTRRKLGKSLRNEQYDEAIVLPRSWKSALVPFFANIPKRIGFHGEQRFILLTERRKLNKKTLNQTVKRFVSLGIPKQELFSLKALPNPQLNVDHDNQAALYKNHHLDTERPAVAMMAGAEYGPAKQWPLKHFHELANQLIRQGYQVWILGGPKDQADGDLIINGLGKHAHNLCGATKLVDAIDLLAAAKVAVSNDSGLMHVAAAVGAKVHGIYGSTSELFTPPLTEHKIIHNLNLDCAPCFKRICPLGHTNCLNQITPKQVLDQI
ncbi:ADP-heptose--LPS heptosyltransferase 2 [Marinomonas gallaica]|uniref:lipopolysaccharide heptosyltransferase II n=1 Tax=Marinomonas gallaica TaxID=1806667 RepID=A0A1C3JMB1_9GAMM|nr:ADP-heptose--LPS heptosyltransferase 2 [Marinomonas gallaica]SBT21317.1 ADP-heptose--LPS heptosyltransferase 2 [Marinomonas gallaica]